MDEQTKVLIAVSPEAPEWMRRVAETMAEGYEGAHGAILTICQKDSQVLMVENVKGADILQALKNLSDTIRERFPADLAEAMIELAIRKKTEEEA